MSNASRRSRRTAEPAVQSDATPASEPVGAPATDPAAPSETPPASEPADGGSEGAQEGGDTSAQGGAGEDGNGGAASEGQSEGEMGARPPLAPLVEAQLQAQTRETLIGTIGEWADSGAREIVRVAGLVAEHGDWTQDELETFAAAFDRVALEAMSSVELMKVQRNAERLLDLSSELEEFGIEEDQVLSISADFRTVVTIDGRKINFGAPVL